MSSVGNGCLALSGPFQQTTYWWYVCFIYPENRRWHFMQIVSIGDSLHEKSNPTSWENKEIFQNVVCWKLLLSTMD